MNRNPISSETIISHLTTIEVFLKLYLPVNCRVRSYKEIGALIEFIAQREVSKEYPNLGWWQVKVSSGGSEVDTFIHINQWNNVKSVVHGAIEKRLKAIFEVDEVDFYQIIERQPWKIELGAVDPARNVPPGSVNFFHSNGSMTHKPLGG